MRTDYGTDTGTIHGENAYQVNAGVLAGDFCQ